MYGWIWNHLPGPTAVRALICTLAFAGLVLVLFTWVNRRLFQPLFPRWPEREVPVTPEVSLRAELHASHVEMSETP